MPLSPFRHISHDLLAPSIPSLLQFFPFHYGLLLALLLSYPAFFRKSKSHPFLVTWLYLLGLLCILKLQFGYLELLSESDMIWGCCIEFCACHFDLVASRCSNSTLL